MRHAVEIPDEPWLLWYHAQPFTLLQEPDRLVLVCLDGDVSMRRTHAAAALLGTVGLIWHACARFPEAGEEALTSGHLALAAALESYRPAEPRLVGGFGHASCRSVPSSGLIPDRACSVLPSPGSKDFAALRRARIRIDAEMKAGLPPAALHARAVLELILDPERGAGRAAGLLEKVVAAAPDNAGAWSDLAAVYLVRARRLDEPRDLVRALEAAERAVLLDGDLPEARFNRALATESLFLPLSGERWRECALHTSERRWRADAMERSRAPEAPRRQTDSRQDVRERGEQDLLGQWAEQEGSRPGSALDRARAVGDELAARSGETLLRDAVATIDAALRAGDRAILDALAHGHQAFRRGMLLYRKGEWEKAARELAASRESLERARSPFAARVRFYEACCLYLLGGGAEAAGQFDRLAGELAGRPYPALLGHVAWMQGVIRVERHDLAAGLRYYEASLAHFERLGEVGYVARVRGMLTWGLHQAGRRRDAWEQAYRALREARGLDDPQQRYSVYATAADLALAEGRPAAALAFQEGTVREAGLSVRGEALVDALFWRGLMRARAGERKQAWADLRLARRQLTRVADPSSRRRMSADLGMAEGELWQSDRPERAVKALSESLGYYEASGNRLLALWVRRLRGQAFRRLGKLDLAEADLLASLTAYEGLGGENDVGRQISFVARTEEAFDEMIAFQALDRRRPGEAFRFADFSQTRVLPGVAVRTRAEGLDAAGRRRLVSAERQPLGLDGVRRRLPPKTTLVQYSVLPDRLLIWRVRPEGVDFFQRPVPARELQRRIGRLRSAAGSLGAWERESSGLFELLVLPWRQGVRSGETVVIVPDKALNAVPFAALQEPGTGRFLVQDLRLVLSPSATLAVEGPAFAARPAPAGRVPALVVGNPAFDRGRWSDLLDLPGAEDEAAELARAIPGATFLRREEATRAAFLDLARRADLIHFAGHSVSDANDPLRSLLLLASSGASSPGAVYAWELYGLDLSATRLVVLAACSTADPALGTDGGVANLARAFLAAGVPRVVASLWAVEDDAANRLFRDLYRHPLARADPAEALRVAQISLLEAPDHPVAPWQWGAFEVFATGF